MKARIRRVGAAAGALALAGAVTALPATAATPEVFVGSAAGRALNIESSLLAAPVTLGVATANADSTLKATAVGIGNVADLFNTEAKSAVTGTGRASKPQACGLALDTKALAGVDLLKAGLACGSSTAEVLGGLPHATSTGTVAPIELTAAGLPVVSTLPIGSTLQTALAPLAATPLSAVSTTVTDLVTSVLKTKALDVKVGASTSSVLTDAAKVTSTATADAAIVKLLPTPELAGVVSGDPVATIAVSSAKASAVYDRKAGVATPTVDPALVTVTINPIIAGRLGLGSLQTIKVAPGVDETILAGTPLASTIKVAAGKTTTNADGSVKAVADGVSLYLLHGTASIDKSILKLELAHAEAGVAGKPATTDPVNPAPVATPPGLELPRTGGPAALVPLAGIGSLVAAFALRRFRA